LLVVEHKLVEDKIRCSNGSVPDYQLTCTSRYVYKFAIELDVLAGKDTAMMLEGVDFGAAVSVLGGQ